jgi:hypothetical protein
MRERDEYDQARHLLAPLRDEPHIPSTVDIRRAITDARRRRRSRRLAGVGVVAAVAAVAAAGVPVALDLATGAVGPAPGAASPVAPPVTVSPGPTGPAPPTECELQILPVPAGSYQSLVAGADPTGRFILGRSYLGEGQPPSGTPIMVVIWVDGEPTTVDMPGSDPSLRAANTQGDAVGSSFLSSTDLNSEVSWIYQDGQLNQLPGVRTSAAALNDAGVVVGSRSEPGETFGVPIAWRSATAKPEDLPLPGASWVGEATGVDVDGTVVGNGFDTDEIPGPPHHSFVWWPDGTWEQLPVPDINGQPADGFAATAIREGVVTGRAAEEFGSGTRFHIVQYNLRTGEFTNLSAVSPVYPQVSNRRGWSAGGSVDGLALWPGQGPGVVLPVPELHLPGDDIGPYHRLTAISDDGRVIAGQLDGLNPDPPLGDGGYPAPAATAVVWRCH